MINLRLVLEYLASPIFCYDVDQMGHLEIDDLEISDDLKRQLKVWDKEFQDTFNDDYPPDSGFSSRQQLQRHIQQGYKLVTKLQLELGESYKINYQPLSDESFLTGQ